MTRAVFAIPGDISTPTGGYRYDREVLARAATQSVDLRHLVLPASFPFPQPEDLLRTAGALVSIAADEVLLIDGLAYGALPESICVSIKSPIVALVHHPLALENGLAPEVADRLRATEKTALGHAARVVVTSGMTAGILARDYEVPEGRIIVAEPGTDPVARASGSGSRSSKVRSLSARSRRRKGYEVLVEALATFGGEARRLVIAGATDRNPDAATRLRAAIARHGLDARITLAGAVTDDELAALYAAADVFVMPSLYEGYGMVLAEAMARGLPIVTTTGGAAAETVPEGAAIKVPPGDATALASGISRLIGNPRLRQTLSDRAWEAGQALPGWDDTSRIIASVIRQTADRTALPDCMQGHPRP